MFLPQRICLAHLSARLSLSMPPGSRGGLWLPLESKVEGLLK